MCISPLLSLSFSLKQTNKKTKMMESLKFRKGQDLLCKLLAADLQLWLARDESFACFHLFVKQAFH